MEVTNYNYWWSKITSATQKAVAVQALHSIPTKSQILEQNNIPFIVRMVDNLARKENIKKQEKKKQKKNPNFNPFLPFDQNLFVGDISSSHVAILNKFNVVDYHLLIITREFESQNNILNPNDFYALWSILQEVDGLAFYNGGSLAGASQPHKHLQLVPYPMSQEIEKTPINDLIIKNKINKSIITLKELPFIHSIAFFDQSEKQSISELVKQTFKYYYELFQIVNITIEEEKPSQDYNLLITREWMMMIPRSKDRFDSISINSLGFSGALLVKNKVDLDKVKKHQPLEILSKVGIIL